MKNNFKIVCQETGLERKAISIGRSKLIYEEMKGMGLKPKIYKLNKIKT